jgi:hypothetical protein
MAPRTATCRPGSAPVATASSGRGGAVAELTSEQIDTLARGFHAVSRQCRHADIIDAPCEQWADVIAPVVADMLAAERERIAQVIEAHGNVEERKPFTPYSSGKFDGLHAAARVVREVPDDH